MSPIVLIILAIVVGLFMRAAKGGKGKSSMPPFGSPGWPGRTTAYGSKRTGQPNSHGRRAGPGTTPGASHAETVMPNRMDIPTFGGNTGTTGGSPFATESMPAGDVPFATESKSRGNVTSATESMSGGNVSFAAELFPGRRVPPDAGRKVPNGTESLPTREFSNSGQLGHFPSEAAFPSANRSDELVRGVIWSEILAAPRAKRPYRLK